MINKRFLAALPLLMLLSRGIPAQGRVLQLSYEDTVKLSVGNSFELKKLMRDYEIATLNYQWAIREFLPQLNLSFTDSSQVKENNPDTDSIILSIGIEQPIFNGGKMLINRKLSRTQLILDHQALEETRFQLINEVWKLYYKYLIYLRKYELQKEHLEVGRAQLVIASTELSIGAITEIDFIDAQIEVQSAELELKETETYLKELDFQFREMTGIGREVQYTLSGTVDETYGGLILPEDSKTLFAIAEVSNLEMKKTRFAAEQARINLNLARTSFIPSLSLGMKFNFSGDDYPIQHFGFTVSLTAAFQDPFWPTSAEGGIGSTDFTDRNRSLTVQMSPLQNPASLLSPVAAKTNLMSAIDAVETQRDGLMFQIEAKSTEYRQKQEILILQDRKYSLQKRKLEVMEKKLEIGESKRIDLMQAQTEYYNMAITRLEYTLDLHNAERDMERLLGLEVGTLEILCPKKQ